jgi:hypothetical protein
VSLCLTMIQKRKNTKTLGNLIYTRGLRPFVHFNQIAFCFGALSITCIIVWRPFCGLNRIHIHAQCGNWSAGISYPHSRTCPLIGSFLLGFTYCDGRERKSDRNVIFRCSFIGSFLPGFHIVTTGNVLLCLTMIQKRKDTKTLSNLINTRGGYAPSYKSDSLVFRCSFYYLNMKNYNDKSIPKL